MTAVDDSTKFFPVLLPSNDSGGSMSKKQQRRHTVSVAADDMAQAAEEAGWTLSKRWNGSSGHSVYLLLRLSARLKILCRVSDHSPNRPIGIANEPPTILVLLGVPGCFVHAKEWLKSTAETVERVRENCDCKCRLRAAAIPSDEV